MKSYNLFVCPLSCSVLVCGTTTFWVVVPVFRSMVSSLSGVIIIGAIVVAAVIVSLCCHHHH